MIVPMILIWILLFVIFFVGGICADSAALGAISGILLLIFGLAILITGVQVESGSTLTVDSGEYTMVIDYADVTLPFGLYSFILGVIFILTAMFILYSNAEDLA